MRVHKAITCFIVKSALFGKMIASVDFDDELLFSAIEICNVDAYCVLPAELLIASLSIAEVLP